MAGGIVEHVPEVIYHDSEEGEHDKFADVFSQAGII